MSYLQKNKDSKTYLSIRNYICPGGDESTGPCPIAPADRNILYENRLLGLPRYSPFHKILPKSGFQLHRISVRFYEMCAIKDRPFPPNNERVMFSQDIHIDLDQNIKIYITR